MTSDAGASIPVYHRLEDGTNQLIGYAGTSFIEDDSTDSFNFIRNNSVYPGFSQPIIFVTNWRPQTLVPSTPTPTSTPPPASLKRMNSMERMDYEKLIKHLVWVLGGAIIITQSDIEASGKFFLNAVEDHENQRITFTALEETT